MIVTWSFPTMWLIISLNYVGLSVVVEVIDAIIKWIQSPLFRQPEERRSSRKFWMSCIPVGILRPFSRRVLLWIWRGRNDPVLSGDGSVACGEHDPHLAVRARDWTAPRHDIIFCEARDRRTGQTLGQGFCIGENEPYVVCDQCRRVYIDPVVEYHFF